MPGCAAVSTQPPYDLTLLNDPAVAATVAPGDHDPDGVSLAEELDPPLSDPEYQRRSTADMARRTADWERKYQPPQLADLARMVDPREDPAFEPDRGVPTPDALVPPPDGPWPEPLDPAALHGPAGDIVRAIEPYSEADPAALLIHTLVGVGALFGSATHAMAADARHPGRLFAVLVGETSRGRKGSSLRPIERILEQADTDFAPDRVVEGLSSGEGVIWAVRDAVEKLEQVGKGADRHPEVVTIDPGVADKRLLVIESEFSSPLRVAQRDGNTLTAVIRRAWDGDRLQTLTKNSPTAATGAHVSLIGHITCEELLRVVDRSDLVNGFANRFLWMLVRRAKLLPHGESVPDQVIAQFAQRIAECAAWARDGHVLRRDAEADDIWEEIYGQLTEGRPGLLGAITSRAEAQVLRLSVLYAILDRSLTITAEHLLAALAVWRYADASAEAIFGDAIGDPIADTILAALRRRGSLTRTDIGNLLSRHGDRHRIEAALASLVAAGLAESSMNRDTGGRPQEVWRPLSSHNLHIAQGSPE